VARSRLTAVQRSAKPVIIVMLTKLEMMTTMKVVMVMMTMTIKIIMMTMTRM
jgi:hypothetical protein